MNKSFARGTILAGTICAVMVLGAAGAQPAAADGVYFCFDEHTIKAAGAEVPYVTPRSITTEREDCPSDTTPVGIG